jgi:hypothetical protein
VPIRSTETAYEAYQRRLEELGRLAERVEQTGLPAGLTQEQFNTSIQREAEAALKALSEAEDRTREAREAARELLPAEIVKASLRVGQVLLECGETLSGSHPGRLVEDNRLLARLEEGECGVSVVDLPPEVFKNCPGRGGVAFGLFAGGACGFAGEQTPFMLRDWPVA